MYLAAGAASPFIYLLLPIQACGQDHTRLSCPAHPVEHLGMLVFVSEQVSLIFLSWCTEILNEDLLSSFTKLRSPASMSSFLDFHGSIVLSPWLSGFPPGAVKCEEINTRKWNVMQLVVAPFTMWEQIDNFYTYVYTCVKWKGGI